MSHDPGDEHHPPRTAYPCGMIQVDGKGTFSNGYEVVVPSAAEPAQATLVITTVSGEDITPMVPVWQRADEARAGTGLPRQRLYDAPGSTLTSGGPGGPSGHPLGGSGIQGA